LKRAIFAQRPPRCRRPWSENDTGPAGAGPDQALDRTSIDLPVAVDEAPEDEGGRDQHEKLEDHQLAHLGSPFG